MKSRHLFLLQSFFKNEPNISKMRSLLLNVSKVLFTFIILWLCLSQVSTFIDFNFNKLNYLLIIVLFSLFLLVDAKRTLFTFFKLTPFIAFLLPLCIVTGFIGKNTFFPEFVTMSIVCGLMFIISLLAKEILFKEFTFKYFCIAYIFGCLLFCVFALIIDRDILFNFSGLTYSYFSKNSAAPMLCCGLIFVPYVFSSHSIKTIFIKSVFYLLFLTTIVLLRCRSVLVCLPIIFLYNIYKVDHNSNEKWIWIIVCLLGAAFVFIIPQLRTIVIDSFISAANGGTSVDDISSGRFTQLFNAFSNFKFVNVIFGKGSGYIDINHQILIMSLIIIEQIRFVKEQDDRHSVRFC